MSATDRCRCGHPRGWHADSSGLCWVGYGRPGEPCECMLFTLPAEAGPAFGGPLCEEDPETPGYCAYHRVFTCDAEEGPSCTCDRTDELSVHEVDCPVPSGGRPERGATTIETLAGLAFAIVICFTVLVWHLGWPGQHEGGASIEEQRKTRHAICEVLGVVGADATNGADVAACTFTGEGN